MKKRIIALVLVVVMSLLTFVGCDKTTDFIDEDLNNYAAFDASKEVDFWTALKNLEIEDAEFTSSQAKRIETLKAQIYTSVVTGMLKADPDHQTTGKIDGGDVFYFVYYGEYTVKAEGEEAKDKKYTFDFSNMDESKVSSITLGDVDDTAFMKGLEEALGKVEYDDLASYIYDVVTKTEVTNDIKNNADVKAEATKQATEEAEKETFEDKDGKTKEQLKEEWIKTKTDEIIEQKVAEALKIDEQLTYVISYKRKLATETSDLEETTKYEILDKDHPLYETIVKHGSLGGLVAEKVEGQTAGKTSFDMEDGYTYSDINIKWGIKNFKEFVSFEVELEEDLKTTPDNDYNSDNTDLAKIAKGTKVTYHVYPVYYISAPAVDEIGGADILNYIVGSNIKAGYFDAFEGAVYKEEGKDDVAVSTLVDELVEIFNTKNEKHYEKGSKLSILLNAYNAAVDAGGSNPTGDKKTAIDNAAAALLKAQLAEAKETVDKISAATDVEGEKNALYTEYYEGLEHTSAEKYNTAIVQKVQKAVWDLIQEYVVVNEYPEKALKEYTKLVYDDYEYNYYKSEKAQQEYDTFTEYLVKELGCGTADKISEKIEEKAKEVLKPTIQIYFVAYELKKDAGKEMAAFVQSDIEAGVYSTDEAAELALEDAADFFVDAAYMKNYKKEVGRRAYKQVIEQYGEINVRTAFQFNKLFSYLTSAKYVKTTEGGEDHAEVEAVLTDDTWTVQFHNSRIGYTAVEPKTTSSSTST